MILLDRFSDLESVFFISSFPPMPRTLLGLFLYMSHCKGNCATSAESLCPLGKGTGHAKAAYIHDSRLC